MPRLQRIGAHFKQLLRDKLVEHKQYICEHGDDMPGNPGLEVALLTNENSGPQFRIEQPEESVSTRLAGNSPTILRAALGGEDRMAMAIVPSSKHAQRRRREVQNKI